MCDLFGVVGGVDINFRTRSELLGCATMSERRRMGAMSVCRWIYIMSYSMRKGIYVMRLLLAGSKVEYSTPVVFSNGVKLGWNVGTGRTTDKAMVQIICDNTQWYTVKLHPEAVVRHSVNIVGEERATA